MKLTAQHKIVDRGRVSGKKKDRKYIDKTTYLDYLRCPKNAWLCVNKPELKERFELSAFEKSLSDMGREVELLAQKLFPNGRFQSTFIFEDFLARTDIMEYDATLKQWNLYEVKASSSLKEENGLDYLEDVSFQTVLLKRLNVPLYKISIIYLNKEYIRGKELDLKRLFTIEDVTVFVDQRLEQTYAKMVQAKEDIFKKTESTMTCSCLYAGRSAHCPTFDNSHPEVPPYSVHDLSHIGACKKALKSLVENGIYALEDIPKDFKLSQIQTNQLRVYQTKRPMIDALAIKKELAELQYPLYFFDYETYAPAIPMFEGFKPFEPIPFQFSLHVFNRPDCLTGKSEILPDMVDNFEYIHQSTSDPSLIIIEQLQSLIGNKGSIIVWNKSFEYGVNKQLASRQPKYARFLKNINNRLYDLRDIFTKQFYVHRGFNGKTSIKSVLPVLAPQLSYKSMAIKEGSGASSSWYSMVFGSQLVPSERQTILNNLMDYCGLDSYAMFVIWKYLVENVS